ncbi:MAG TPA: aromatic ring-hydroxylating dioxygenase subunit alpha [Rhodospirillales bacterium]|nr:aromatic ring-hydroxylating dioxygenase subunit alpha [Rhodospirillales bacterium]HIL75277.1 aromatic ring-hydroxylating dioxygenase subunit alpha [Rhodospirillales bacterium]
MDTIDHEQYAGSGYLNQSLPYDPTMTEVTRGTPMGELLRRYWHPIGLNSHATETPKKVSALGEDLILFRDRQGRPGLVHANCCHRGTTLYYGKVDEDGLRCCYHGWAFDVEGHCTSQPCEPNGGRGKQKIRQPWYPLKEHYGLIFAYMGPPDRIPILPTYECLEVLAEDEFLEANDTSVGSGGPVIVDCNWLQHYENVVDPYHVPILHGSFSGTQFTKQMGAMPDVEFEQVELGIKVTSLRPLDGDRTHRRITMAVLPTLRVVPSPRVSEFARVSSIGWVLPIDNTAFRIYTCGRTREEGAMTKGRSRLNGKLWEELTPDEHQKFPGDYEAHSGQGEIAVHANEHLGQSDVGIVMLRHFLKKQVDAVMEGKNPVGVSFNKNDLPIVLEAGNYAIDEPYMK